MVSQWSVLCLAVLLASGRAFLLPGISRVPPQALHGPVRVWASPGSSEAQVSAETAVDEPVVGRMHFIRRIVEDDLATGKHSSIVTRFPPEPNGYLHIGHAKSICLNFGLGKEYGGRTNMRFDDTNPVKEDIEYVNAILEDVQWLMSDSDTAQEQVPWDGEVKYSSNYFDLLHECAVFLIKEGKAYVDSLSADEMREYRGTLTSPGKDSPDRSRSVEDNLDLFRRMREGEFSEGEYVLRAKIDMTSPNLNMRDPTIYRIRHAHHPMTGDKWCVYPMYDYTHCISDALESITHSLCTLEFADHRPLYDWVLDQLEPAGLIPCHPRQIEFSRLNLQYTVLSKRKLIQLVQGTHVSGWSDPRMPTISGLRRRGYPPESIRLFCERVGISKAENNIDMSVLEDCARLTLDDTAERAFAVLDPLKVTITNWPEDEGAPNEEEFQVPVHPKKPQLGHRNLHFGREVFIDRSDFLEESVAGFNRLVTGGMVRLKYAYVVSCDEVVRDSDGKVVELRCTYHPETRAGAKPPGFKKVKGIIQWLSPTDALTAEVRLYDRLFVNPMPGKAEGAPSEASNDGVDGGGSGDDDDDDTPDFLRDLNQESVQRIKTCLVEASAGQGSAAFQFERLGYFVHDSVDSTPNQPVFNRVVTLRDTWAASAAATAEATTAPTEASGEAGRFPYVDDPKAQKGVPDIQRVELRVGQVVSAEMHPDADSLLVQSIDCGDEEGPRTIVSGIAKYFSPEDLSGRRVIVACNLKPAKMRGIASAGMVLAASQESGDDELVELVEAPEGAQVGERLCIEGEDPGVPDRLLKSDGQQKVWKRVAPALSMNSDAEFMHDGKRLMSSAGPCTVRSLANAPVR